MSATYRHDTVSGFRKQARDDAGSSRCLFDNGHYGNSAYLCQQSIEKTIKAVMVERELTTKDVKKLRHMPLVDMWNTMGLEAEYLASITTDEKAKEVYENLRGFSDIGKRIFRESTTSAKTAWWKLSLNIPLTASEDGKIKRFISDFKKSIGRMIDVLDHLAVLAGSKHARRMGLKQARNAVKRASASLAKCMGELGRVSNLQNGSEQIRQMEVGLNQLRRASSTIMQQYQQTAYFMYYFTVMQMWAIEFAIPILKITPHEDMGRYPMVVGRQKSIAWYEEKRNELRCLEENVECACRELESRMRPNVRRHHARFTVRK